MIYPEGIPPNENKRVQVRYNIRMKMFKSNGLEFPSTLDAQKAKKFDRNKSPAKIASKVTQQSVQAINYHMYLTREENN